MLKKSLIIYILGLLIVPNIVSAQPQHIEKKHPEVISAKTTLADTLALTDKQRTKAIELRKQSQQKIKPLRDKLFALNIQLSEGKFNPAQSKKINSEIRSLKQKIVTLQIENERQFIQILTPEQKYKYLQIKEERKKQISAKHRK